MSDLAKRLDLNRALSVLGPFIGLILVMGLFAVLAPDRFVSAYNLKTIVTQTVIVALGAIGMTWVIIGGGIDLSVGSVIALSSVAAALFVRDGYSPAIAIVVGVVVGASVGALNGALITGLRVVPFIVTLGTMLMARGVAKWLGDEQKVDVPETWLDTVMSKNPDPSWLVLSPGVWTTLILAVVMAFALRRTVIGTHTIAVGSNEDTARLCGVRVSRVKIILYGIAGSFAGLAGVMQLGRLTVGDPTTAIGLELDIIAAVVIGGGSLSGGRGSILGSMIGAFLMAVLANGCTLTGVPNYVREILTGAIIIAAVAVDGLRQRPR
ncbi:MAG: ABC transporter permease [Deltaproteobacteria bacterium]|nr:MAG: ABC transporter permease [Deltaproteobacteria bacterium]